MNSSSWDGAVLLSGLTFATDALVARTAEIDALNVYPVPDGDTGTNMSLTMQSAIDAACQVQRAKPRATDVASAIARGALIGARGNSGVILSQIFRGFAE